MSVCIYLYVYMVVHLQVVSTDNLMGGGGGRCQLLGSLDTNMEVVTASSVWLTRGAMQGMKGAGVSEVGETP